jgi:hypothetical protein
VCVVIVVVVVIIVVVVLPSWSPSSVVMALVDVVVVVRVVVVAAVVLFLSFLPSGCAALAHNSLSLLSLAHPLFATVLPPSACRIACSA